MYPALIRSCIVAILLVAAKCTLAQECVDQPPVLIGISKDLFVEFLQQPIELNTEVDDVILGVRAIGSAHTQGCPEITLLEDAARVTLLVTLRGTTASQTVAHQHPAIVHSRSEMSFVATKRVTFDSASGFTSEPAKAAARTTRVSETISSTRRGLIGRIVRRVAAREVAASRSQVEAISRARAQRRIAALFDKLLQERLERANRLYAWQASITRLVTGNPAVPWYCSSTPQGLRLVFHRGEQPIVWAALPALHVEKGAPISLCVRRELLGAWDKAFASLDRALDRVGRLIEPSFEQALSMSDERGADASSALEPRLDYRHDGEWIVVQLRTDLPETTRIAQAPGRDAR